MQLKTKLVLAITALVLLIAGLLSLVYVSQLLHASIEGSWETNHMVANQVRFALQNALKTLSDRKVDPNNPTELRNLTAETVRNNQALQAVLDSVNRYSLTVYDINIGDAASRTLLSTDPENQDKPLPSRPDYNQLRNASYMTMISEVGLGPPKVYDVIVPLESNGKLFATVHVGVRTTFLRQAYKPWLRDAVILMTLAVGAALVVALLLSNLALRPLEEISMQLDYWTSANEAGEIVEPGPRQDTAARVSTKIEQIGQRMRNVEEVFSALKDNLDQILGNLQDGILLFTGEGRAVLISEAARRLLQIEHARVLGLHTSEIFDNITVLGRALQNAFNSRTPLARSRRFAPKPDGAFRPLSISSRTTQPARGWGRSSPCAISSQWRRSSPSWNCHAAWRLSGGSPPALRMK